MASRRTDGDHSIRVPYAPRICPEYHIEHAHAPRHRHLDHRREYGRRDDDTRAEIQTLSHDNRCWAESSCASTRSLRRPNGSHAKPQRQGSRAGAAWRAACHVRGARGTLAACRRPNYDCPRGFSPGTKSGAAGFSVKLGRRPAVRAPRTRNRATIKRFTERSVAARTRAAEKRSTFTTYGSLTSRRLPARSAGAVDLCPKTQPSAGAHTAELETSEVSQAESMGRRLRLWGRPHTTARQPSKTPLYRSVESTGDVLHPPSLIVSCFGTDRKPLCPDVHCKYVHIRGDMARRASLRTTTEPARRRALCLTSSEAIARHLPSSAHLGEEAKRRDPFRTKALRL